MAYRWTEKDPTLISLIYMHYSWKCSSWWFCCYMGMNPELRCFAHAWWIWRKPTDRITLRNILYRDINGICSKFNEYDRAKKLQLILSSSQIMRFTVPFDSTEESGLYCYIIVIECRSICFHFICTFLLCLCLFDLCTLFVYIPCICLQPFEVKLSIE